MDNSEKNYKIKKSSIKNSQSQIFIDKLSGGPTANSMINSNIYNKSNFNEDSAMEMIDLEFKDLEEWLKIESKRLKNVASDMCETIKIDKFKK